MVETYAAVAAKMPAIPALAVNARQRENSVVKAATIPRHLLILSIAYSSTIEAIGSTQAKVVVTILVPRWMAASPHTRVSARCSPGP
jgi:hypothetical protein